MVRFAGLIKISITGAEKNLFGVSRNKSLLSKFIKKKSCPRKNHHQETTIPLSSQSILFFSGKYFNSYRAEWQLYMW
jgi:hypothetical protein